MKKRFWGFFFMLAVIAAAAYLLIGLFTADLRIYTSGSGVVQTDHYDYLVNSVYRFRIHTLRNNLPGQVNYSAGKKLVSMADPDFYDNRLHQDDKLVFQTGNAIYYYRKDNTKNFFCLDTGTGEIRSCEFSRYAKIPENGEFGDSFPVFNSIIAEGLMDRYKGLAKAVEELTGPDGTAYETNFHEAGGRVFFEHKARLYEYNIVRDELDYVCGLPSDETVDRIELI